MHQLWGPQLTSPLFITREAGEIGPHHTQHNCRRPTNHTTSLVLTRMSLYCEPTAGLKTDHRNRPLMQQRSSQPMHSLNPRNGQTALSMCTCGKLHFRYGLVTLHFESNEFTSFANAVAHLHARYKELGQPQPSGTIPTLHNDFCH